MLSTMTGYAATGQFKHARQLWSWYAGNLRQPARPVALDEDVRFAHERA